MATRKGHRGYIGSRAYGGSRVPQHIQNLVIREYCRQRGFEYLLSESEYAMDGSYMMLERIVEELPSIQGAVLYSLFMLPEDGVRRRAIYDRVLGCGAELHAAVEGVMLRSPGDIQGIEDVFLVSQWLENCPKPAEILG